jgi:hypothetical protein
MPAPLRDVPQEAVELYDDGTEISGQLFYEPVAGEKR